ncbi:MAG: VWA domain-containing protein [Bacteroidales bacterium]|nr:VWA domain-containing protein [Bacteroidales bacterium]
MGCAGFLYLSRRARTDFPTPVRWGLFALRFLSVFGLLVLLLSPVWKRHWRETEPPLLVWAIDASASMRGVWGDSAARAGALAVVAAESQAATGPKAEWRPCAFGTHTRRLAVGRAPSWTEAVAFDDAYTDVSDVLSTAARWLEGRHGAVILLSDGRYNHGADPQETASVAAPVFTICTGDTAAADDWYIARWEQNAYTYRGAEFPLKVYVGYRGVSAGAWPQLEIRQDGRLLRRERVDAAALASGMELYLPATDTGIQVYEMRLTGAADERLTERNRRTFYIQVLNEKTSVRVLTAETHPDVGAIRRALSGDGRHELTVHPFVPALFDSLSADLWVLYGCPTAADGLNPATMRALQRLVREKPVWFFLTPQTSALAFNRLQTGLELPLRPVFAEVGAAYRRDFSDFRVEGAALVGQLPPLYAPLGLTAAKGSALLYQRVAQLETPAPLWWFNLQGGRRIGVLTGQGLWRWRLWEQTETGNSRLFDALIRQSVRLLAVREEAEALQVQAEPFYGQGMPVEMQASLYDAGGWAVPDADVQAALRDSGGQVYRLAFEPTGGAYRLVADFLPPGPYTYTVSATYGDRTAQRQGYFRVGAASIEQPDLPADRDGMRRLAAHYGGAAYDWDGHDREQLRRIMRQIHRQLTENAALQPQTHVRTESRPLNQNVWWLLGILALMGAEYALRRLYTVA